MASEVTGGEVPTRGVRAGDSRLERVSPAGTDSSTPEGASRSRRAPDTTSIIGRHDAMTNTASKSVAVRRFFDGSQEYLTRSFNIRARAHLVGALLGKLSETSILDLGCGDGSISRQFLSDSNRLTLVDFSENMLQAARRETPLEYRSRTRFIHGDLTTCRFVDEFDVVLCLGVLAHVDSVEDTLRAISSFLKKGGRCILQITDADSLHAKAMELYCALRGSKSPELDYATNRTTSSMVQALAAQNGLQLLKQCRYAVPMPGMLWLSDRVLFRYEIATAKVPWLSRSGSEVLFLFAKR